MKNMDRRQVHKNWTLKYPVDLCDNDRLGIFLYCVCNDVPISVSVSNVCDCGSLGYVFCDDAYVGHHDNIDLDYNGIGADPVVESIVFSLYFSFVYQQMILL